MKVLVSTLLLLTVPALALAQEGDGSWIQLHEFEGELVDVMEVGGRTTTGRLADTTDAFVLVAQGVAPATVHVKIDRSNVHRINLVQPSTRAKHTLLGMVYGVGSCAIFGYVIGGPHVRDVKWKPMGVLGVALVGVTGGALVGFATSKPESRNIIYEPSKNGPQAPQP